MVAQLRAPVIVLPWLLTPTPPPESHTGRAAGFRRGNDRNVWEFADEYRDIVGIAQRIVARYALGYEGRAALGQRYGYADRHVQAIITGQTYNWLTLPVRQRFLANGIGNLRMNRDHANRADQIRRAFESLSARAVEYMRWPEHYPYDVKQQVSDDLYLLSGAWREELS